MTWALDRHFESAVGNACEALDVALVSTTGPLGDSVGTIFLATPLVQGLGEAN